MSAAAAAEAPRAHDIPLLIVFVAGTRLHREQDLVQHLPVLRNGPPGTFVHFPDGLRVSLPTDQIVHQEDGDAGVRVGLGGMRFDGPQHGQLIFHRVREMHPEEELSPARSHTMKLQLEWVQSVIVEGQEVWPATGA